MRPALVQWPAVARPVAPVLLPQGLVVGGRARGVGEHAIADGQIVRASRVPEPRAEADPVDTGGPVPVRWRCPLRLAACLAMRIGHEVPRDLRQMDRTDDPARQRIDADTVDA